MLCVVLKDLVLTQFDRSEKHLSSFVSLSSSCVYPSSFQRLSIWFFVLWFKNLKEFSFISQVE